MIKNIFIFCGMVLLFACNNTEKPVTTAQSMTETNQKKIPVIAPTVESVYNIKPTGKTSFGYEYIKHNDAGGDLIQAGDYAYFSYYVKMRDSIVGSSIGADLGKVRIDSSKNQSGKQPSPVMDALRLMAKGDSVTVYWPTEQVPQVPPEYRNEPFVVYDLVLKEIKNEEEYRRDLEKEQEARRAERTATRKLGAEIGNETIRLATKYRRGELKGKLTETASGLKYIIHNEGNGSMPKQGNTVVVHYYGILTNGATFDHSYKTGQTFSFPLGQGRVIPGWDEALALFKEGTKATIFVPYQLAYGEAGKPPLIPERSELIFHIDFQKIYK